MCRHVLFVLALSFILFYCVTLTRNSRSFWISSESTVKRALSVFRLFSVFVAARPWNSPWLNDNKRTYTSYSSIFLPLWEQPHTLTLCRLRSSGTCMSAISHLSSIRRPDLSLAAEFSTRITTGMNVSYHIDPFEVTSALYVLLYSLNSSAAHWAEGFLFLHGMVTILNRFSSAGFDVCSSSMG